MSKILFIVQHRKDRSPGQRFRCEQYLQALEDAGFQIEYSNLLSEKDDRVFYAKGRYLAKFFILIKSIVKRLGDVKKAKNADIVFIYREAFMLGSIFFEKRFKKTGASLVYDFDDSIWLNDTSDGNKNLSWMKRPEKTNEIIALSDFVIVGNDFLKSHCLQFNRNVTVFPTTIDTSYHLPAQKKEVSGKVCIGWTGTSTTLKHFKGLLPVLLRLKEKYGNRIYFKAVLDADYKNEDLQLESKLWTLDSEIDDLQEMDIGIMPLPNDEWSNGKCGFKGLQYMSLEIPTIMSPVGVNVQIIENGVNGFLAYGDLQWECILSDLIENEEKRLSIGKQGRLTVQNFFSVDAHKDRYVHCFKNIAEKKTCRD